MAGDGERGGGDPRRGPGAGSKRPRRVFLAVNERSRRGRAGGEGAAAALRAAGLDVVVGASGDLPARLGAGSFDGAVVGGGDGTASAAAGALAGTGMPLGILPLGTANDFARSLGIPLDLAAAARVVAEGHVHRVDLGEVNGHLFLNVASIGVAADVARSLTTERKRRFGRFSYALTAIRLLADARPFHATLRVGPAAPEQGDDPGGAREELRVRTLQITVGNGRFYGGGNVVAVDAAIDDGLLDLYSLEFADVWRRALLIPTFASGRHGAVREVRTARARSFVVRTRTPRPVNADGELVTQTPAVFIQRAAALDVLVPAGSALLAGRR